MNEPIPPLLVIPSFELAQDGRGVVMTKGFISSLMRSLFSGRILVFRNNELALFKVERSALDEMFVPAAVGENSDAARRHATLEFLFGLCGYVTLAPRQWVIVADAGSVALRNIDHLIPLDKGGPYAPPEVDFFWTRAGKDEVSNQAASPGLWAVRGEHLPMVLGRLKAAWSMEAEGSASWEEGIWTRVVQELPLKKRAFEKGEVVAPQIGAVDWVAVSNAAFVTVPDWPEKEALKFLQALYFGTYLGDETGMMLNILEA